LRVISGLKKGHRLKSPKGLDVRPTEDRIKESLFNILGTIHPESIVLDLFAGSGAIGIEFLSRGALKSYFVDISPLSLAVVKENLIHTGFLESSQLIKMEANKVILQFNKSNLKFDYIFLDPPFNNKDLLLNIIEVINNNQVLSTEGIIIIEHEKDLILEDNLGDLIKYKSKNYGRIALDFYNMHNIRRG
jgi:16S rRNA (guanine(966)-N(2))-methyltransferase RsmD